LDGSAPRVLPDRYTFVPDGRGGLWRVGPHGAQRITVAGDTQGTVRALPVGFNAARGSDTPQLTNLVVVGRPHPGVARPGGLLLELWDPDNGRTMAIPSTCTGVASTVDVAAYTHCNKSTVYLLDPRTGRTSAVPIPGGYDSASSIAISPNGGSVGVALSGPAGVAVGIVDLHTHLVQVLPDDDGLLPTEWSADSSTLVLVGNNGRQDALAYWQPGMSGVAAIRVPVDADETHLAVVP